MTARAADSLRERFLSAAFAIIDTQGVGELTVRRLAEGADSTTMGVYTHFGGRAGVLNALYARSFELLQAVLAPAAQHGDPSVVVLRLGLVYRRFALENAQRYTFMFERPIPDFEPPPELRDQVIPPTLGLLQRVAEAALADPSGTDATNVGYLLWCAMHGMISIELQHALRTPLPQWFTTDADVAEAVFVRGLTAMMAGLGLRPPDPSALADG